MDVDFFDSYPYRPLNPDLASLMRAAQRVDAAVAFSRWEKGVAP